MLQVLSSDLKQGGVGEPRSKGGEVEGKRLGIRISRLTETGKNRENNYLNLNNEKSTDARAIEKTMSTS